MYIKKYFFHNSAGQVAPPVYVIGDDSLEPEDCITVKVTGLSNTNAVGAFGYLVFCQSRAGNDSFYVWYVTTVVLPFVKEVRENLGSDGLFPNGDRMAAFVSCDGEASRIRVLMSEDVVARFKDVKVFLGKTPRSCSGVTQASDISQDFKAEKKVMKNIKYSDFQNPVLKQLLQDIMDSLHNFSDEIKKLMVTSLLQLTYTAHSVINLHIVVDGYTQFGQQGGNIDLFKILSAIRSTTPAKQKTLMQKLLPQFVDMMRARHQITEKEMDEAGIMNVNRKGTLPSENATISHKRAVLINGSEIIDEYARHVERLLPATRAARVAANQLDSAEKALRKAREDVAMGEESDARALAKVADQANRRAEKLRKLEEKRAAKVAKQLAQVEERVLLATMSKADRIMYVLEKATANLASAQQIAINAGVINNN